ncbi:MAG: hypothetical protein HQL36_07975 [Alphaproteobacteria bacterium]|nr:hypothetical protein [Alphaproteobacteria bacterium]
MAVQNNKFLGEQFIAIANATGYASAVLICKKFGGLEKVYVPKFANLENPFMSIVGKKGCSRLARAFGGQRIDIPKPPRSAPKKVAIIDSLLENRKGDSEIALTHGVTQRYVRAIRTQLINNGIDVPSGLWRIKYPVPPIPHEKVFDFLGWEKGGPHWRAAISAADSSVKVAIDAGTVPSIALGVRSLLRWIYGLGRKTKAARNFIPLDRRDNPKSFLIDALKIIEQYQPEAIGKARDTHGQD